MVEGETSSVMPMISGIPQGSVRRPSLFLFYINYIPNNITYTVLLLLMPQQDLDKLAKWETSWKMEFHPQKCHVIPITRQQYMLLGQILGNVSQAKYIGVTIAS